MHEVVGFPYRRKGSGCRLVGEMFRNGLVVVLAGVTSACLGVGAGLVRGDLNSEVELSFEAGATEATQALFAFDPAQHSMDITISIQPLDQADDMNVVIVTESGTRFQVLGSFAFCTEEEETRLCQRKLPLLPSEQVGSWRVEAERVDATLPASVEVKVNWIPIGS